MSELRGSLEPPGLVGHFLQHPPEGFTPRRLAGRTPAFHAPFDLLTTAEPAVLRQLDRLKLRAPLRRWLTWETCFVGTTVSEFAPLPAAADARTLVEHWLADWSRQTRLLIVKDIPDQTELIAESDQAFAADLMAACRERGFVLLEGQALAYVPIDFASETEYLERLSSGRRKDLRRKLRSRGKISVEVLPTGSPELRQPSLLSTLYGLFEAVYAQSEIHFDKLSRGFFDAVFGDASLDGLVVLYRDQSGELIGFNLCFCHQGMLVDKFIGLSYPAVREHNLYFVSWFENLRIARERGLSHYVAGWTDPAVKATLGARFTMTRHAVYIRDPLLRRVLTPLADLFESDARVVASVANPRV